MPRLAATYKLLFGPQEGERISRAHGLVVSAGTALQQIIARKAPHAANYQARLEDPSTNKTYRCDILTPNLATELKLGYEFDTKKAKKEVEDIKEFARLSSVRQGRLISPAICLFQAESKEDIAGFKTDTSGIVMLTGRELCQKFGLDYNDVLLSLQAWAKEKLSAKPADDKSSQEGGL